MDLKFFFQRLVRSHTVVLLPIALAMINLATPVAAQSVRLTIKNNLDAPVQMFWIHPQTGKEEPYGDIPAGQPVSQESGVNQTWVFRQNGQIIQRYLADAQPEQVISIGTEDRAQTGNAPTTDPAVLNLDVYNPSAMTIDIYYKDPDTGKPVRLPYTDPDTGKRVGYLSVAGGKTLRLNTYANYDWLFAYNNVFFLQYTTRNNPQQRLTIPKNTVDQVVAHLGATTRAPQQQQQYGTGRCSQNSGTSPSYQGQFTSNGWVGKASQIAGFRGVTTKDYGPAIVYNSKPFRTGKRKLWTMRGEKTPNPSREPHDASYELSFTPVVIAWVDGSNGDLHVTLDTNDVRVQLDGAAKNDKFSRGPFVESFATDVYVPTGMSKTYHWPLTKMGSTSISNSRGTSINANISPIAMMSGVGGGQNFDTTLATNRDTYEVDVEVMGPNSIGNTGRGSRRCESGAGRVICYRYKLCVVGDTKKSGHLCPYQSLNDIKLMSLEPFGETFHELETIAFNFNAGRSTTTFSAEQSPALREQKVYDKETGREIEHQRGRCFGSIINLKLLMEVNIASSEVVADTPFERGAPRDAKEFFGELGKMIVNQHGMRIARRRRKETHVFDVFIDIKPLEQYIGNVAQYDPGQSP